MTAPWAVSCSCGWVAVAETLNEAAELVEVHAEGVKEITRHAIMIKGDIESLKHGGRRRPPPGLAPI
jgi:hypothetical protein